MRRTVLAVLATFVMFYTPWRLMALVGATLVAPPTEQRLSSKNGRYWDVQDLQNRLKALGWDVEYVDLPEGYLGVTSVDERKISVSTELSWNGRLAVLAHEAGHTRQPEWSTHNEGEAFAEAVSVLIDRDDLWSHARYLARMRMDSILTIIGEWRRIERTANLLTTD